MVVDLSELLDLHEDGFAVQTSERLEMNRAVTLCLDLPETKSYIHGSGQVIWSDDTGRGGIRFSAPSREFPADPERMAFCQPADCLRQPCRSNRATRAARGRGMSATNRRQVVSYKGRYIKPPMSFPISDGSVSSSPVEAVRREVRETR